MKRTLTSTLAALVAIGFLATKAEANPFVIGGQTYALSAPSEIMTASFLLADGGVSANLYKGLVEITVSGTGQSLGARFNDAFYVFTGGPIFADPSFYQLTSDNAPLVGNNPAQDAKNFIVYDVDANVEVLSRPFVPAYRVDHTYALIMDLSLLGVAVPSHLHFGVSDGIFADNSGNYNIQITQLAAVPEPASLILLGSGCVCLARRVRRGRKAVQP